MVADKSTVKIKHGQTGSGSDKLNPNGLAMVYFRMRTVRLTLIVGLGDMCLGEKPASRKEAGRDHMTGGILIQG